MEGCVRRNVDAPGPTLILDREGRALPFDGRRLTASIRRTLTVLNPAASSTTAFEAEDLSRVIGRFLELSGARRTLSAESLAGHVLQVLQSAGHEEAARLYARSRSRREQGVALRISDLIEAEADLPRDEAVLIGSEVEQGLAAAGLRDPSASLLREWVDHVLRRRGLAQGLVRPALVGLSPDSLKSLLADGQPGLSAELRGARGLLSSYAMSNVFPEDVALAHSRGQLDLGALAPCNRVHGLCVAPWGLPQVRKAPAETRMAALGELLRDLAGLVSHEVRVLWNGPRPEGQDLLRLEHHLAMPVDVGARIVLCIDGSDPELVRAFLAHPSLTRTCRLRVYGPKLEPTLIPEIVARTADVEVARRAPRPGLVVGSCAVSLLRHALQARRSGIAEDFAERDVAGSDGRGDPTSFLDAIEDTAELAATGLAAWHDLGVGKAAGESIEEKLGQSLPKTWWLEPAGMVQARVVLLGAGAQARRNGRDLAVSVGDRLRRGWISRWPYDPGDNVWEPQRLGGGPSDLELHPASPRVQRRFRRLDLPLEAPRSVKSEDPQGATSDPEQEPLGEGETFSHDGEADPAARGREVVELRRSLGCAEHAPAPRKASDASVRETFLRAFLEPSLNEADISPCA